eukprot:scaffold268_cov236-Pinguiococcus_pyrenoidosus.AAC.13
MLNAVTAISFRGCDHAGGQLADRGGVDLEEFPDAAPDSARASDRRLQGWHERSESNERRVQELATVATIFVAGWTDIFQGTRREGSGRDASRLALLLWTAKHPEMALACRHGGTSTLFPCEKGEVAR